MRKLGICVLLAGAVAGFPAAYAQDEVVDAALPVDAAVPTDETIGAVGDGTQLTTEIGETVSTELVDPQPEDGGDVVDDGGEVIGDDGGVVDDGGEVIGDDGEVVDDTGEVIDDGGEVVDDGGEVIDDGGEVVDDGGEVIDDEGEVVDDGGEIIADDGEVIDDAGEVVDDTGEVIVDGGEIKVGEVVGDGTVGEVIFYTMTPGEEVNAEVVRDNEAAGGDPVAVDGQLATDDGLVYATGAPEAQTAAAGPLESQDAAQDPALPAEVDDAARADEALPAAFPPPMDVIDSESPKY